MKVNLFLIAAPRSGSTQMASWLDTHDDISLLRVKEPNYFSAQHYLTKQFFNERMNDIPKKHLFNRNLKDRIQFMIITQLESYQRLAAEKDAKFILDASTTYIARTEVLHEIYRYNSKAKIIFLERNHVDRAKSHYQLMSRLGIEGRNISQIIDDEKAANPDDFHTNYLSGYTIDYGATYTQISNIFGATSVIRIKFDEFTIDPKKVFDRIASFLEIRDEFDFSVENQASSNVAIPIYMLVILNKLRLKQLTRSILGERALLKAKSLFLTKAKVELSRYETKLLSEYVTTILQSSRET